jgi:hypothetical protein
MKTEQVGGDWRMVEKKWSHHDSPASLDLSCSPRLRLAAKDAVLGPESTRMHVLRTISSCSRQSICFTRKSTGLGCQASLCAHSVALFSVSLFHLPAPPAAWLGNSRPPYCSPRTFSLLFISPHPFCLSLSNHIHALVPEVLVSFLPLSLSIILSFFLLLFCGFIFIALSHPYSIAP